MASFVGGGAVKSYTVVAGFQALFPQGFEVDVWGYRSTGIGSISPAIFGPTGSSIIQIASTGNGGTVNSLIFQISGPYPQNSFTSLTVGSNTFTSASASFSNSGNSQWVWGTSTNLFPVAGNSYTVTFI